MVIQGYIGHAKGQYKTRYGPTKPFKESTEDNKDVYYLFCKLSDVE